MTSIRVESDSMGTINVPSDKYYGAQTARSLANFDIGTEKMPVEIIRAFGILKKAAALANFKLGLMDEATRDLIVTAADVVARVQPNSDSIGSIRTPMLERNAAAATRAPRVTAATIQAGWMRRGLTVALLHTDERGG